MQLYKNSSFSKRWHKNQTFHAETYLRNYELFIWLNVYFSLLILRLHYNIWRCKKKWCEKNYFIKLEEKPMNWITYEKLKYYLWKFILLSFLLDHSVIIFFFYIFNSSAFYWHIDYNLIYLYCYAVTACFID